MREAQSLRQQDENFPSHLPGVTHGCRRPAALLPVVDREKNRGMADQKAVAFQVTVQRIAKSPQLQSKDTVTVEA